MKSLIFRLILAVLFWQFLPPLISVEGGPAHISGSVYTPQYVTGSIRAWIWCGMKAIPKAKGRAPIFTVALRKWHNVKPEIGWKLVG